MTNKCVIEKLKSPHKISLYRNTNTPNIYYYFRFKKIKYQGSTGSDNIDIARNKVYEIFFEISKGMRAKGRHTNYKFEKVVKKFLVEKTLQRLSPRTLIEYKRQAKFLIERFRDFDLASLCSKKIYLDYCDWRRNYYLTHEKKRQVTYKKNGKTIKGQQLGHVGNVPINRECRLLVSILRFAKDSLDLLKNVNIPSYKILPENRRNVILDKDEYQILKEYWLKKNPYYWQIISFVNNTGIRYPSELNRICYKDLHLERSYVLIRDRKNKNKSEPINTPVPIVGRAREIIEELISRENIPNQPDDPLFVNDKGKQILSITKPFKRSLVECGINKNLTMYSLRHLFTTRMVRRPDIPIKVLSDVLGHKDTSMIDKHYAHLRAEVFVNVFQRSEDHKQEFIKMQNQKK